MVLDGNQLIITVSAHSGRAAPSLIGNQKVDVNECGDNHNEFVYLNKRKEVNIMN